MPMQALGVGVATKLHFAHREVLLHHHTRWGGYLQWGIFNMIHQSMVPAAQDWWYLFLNDFTCKL